MTRTRIARRPVAAAALALGALSAGAIVAIPALAKTARPHAQVLHLRANAAGRLRFDRSRLRAHPGVVTLVMTNPRTSGMSHGISVEGHGVDRDGPIVAPGGTSHVTVTLRRKGTYAFYCPVPGHRAAGMRGLLTIR